MIISYYLALLLMTKPYVAIALLGEFKTKERCEKAIEKIEVDESDRAKMFCLATAHDGV